MGDDPVFSYINRVGHERSLPFFSRVPYPPKLLVLVYSDGVLLLRPIEESEGEDRNGKGSWCNTSVFTLSLSQNISFHDKIQLPGKIGKVHALTYFAHLITDRAKSILRLVL